MKAKCSGAKIKVFGGLCPWGLSAWYELQNIKIWNNL